jgi:hypothetical protein
MKLPNQAAPIQRIVSTAKAKPGISASGLCELLCDRLPEPARSLCKAAC